MVHNHFPLLLLCYTQAYAIFEAATNVMQAGGSVHPHIMIPLVGIVDELESQVG